MGSIFDAVIARSYDASASIRYGIVMVDGKLMLYIDSRGYNTSYNIEGHFTAGTITSEPKPLTMPSEESLAGRATNRQMLDTMLHELKQMDASHDLAKYTQSMKSLNRMGLIGDIIGLSMMLIEANAAYLDGNTAKAQQLMSDWLLALGGGIVAAGVALEALSPVLASIAATGPMGVVLAGGLSLLIGLSASVFGAAFSVEAARWLDSLFDKAVTYTDPLLVDLDGDGVETIANDGTLMFDFDGDGVKTSTGWVGPDDALLVLDKNHDGIINSGQELFGTDTVKRDGTLALSSFDALQDLDSDLNGQFDAQDDLFSQTQLWRDSNSDGITQTDELKSLNEYGISSLALSGKRSHLDSYGNMIMQTASFVREDGTTGQIAEVDLATDPFYQEFTDDQQSPIDATGLPDLQGTGAVHDLHAAIDLSSELALQVIQYRAATTATEQIAQLDSLLANWANTAHYPTFAQRLAAQGSDTLTLRFVWSWEKPGKTRQPTAEDLAKQTLLNKVAVLEPFTGQDFFIFSHQQSQTTFTFTVSCNGINLLNNTYTLTGGPQELLFTEKDMPLPARRINLIEQSYNTLRQRVYQGLAVQTRLQQYLGTIDIALDSPGEPLDYSGPLALLRITAERDPITAFMDARSLELNGQKSVWDPELQRIKQESINHLTGDQPQVLASLLSSLNETLIIGTLNNDALYAKEMSYQMFGGAGDDYLRVGTDNNLVSGGRGNDTLVGCNKNDTYLFSLGDGHDILSEYGGHNRLIFGEGIGVNDIEYVRQGKDLCLSILGGQDSITLKNVFNTIYADAFVIAGNEIESFLFADGKELSWQQALSAGVISRASDDSDTTLYGYKGTPNQLFGGAGNDRLVASQYDNVFSGGRGDDTLTGGTGNDTYLFNMDDGHDVIYEVGGHNRLVFGPGIRSGDLTFTRQSRDIVINIHDGKDSITMKNAYPTASSTKLNTSQMVEVFTFADGSELTWQQVISTGLLLTSLTDALQ